MFLETVIGAIGGGTVASCVSPGAHVTSGGDLAEIRAGIL